MKRFTVLAALLAVTSLAQADVITFDFSNPLATTEINQTGSLGLFDSSLGTLTSAVLTVNGRMVTSFSGTNRAAQAQRATLTSSLDLDWTSTLAGLNPHLQPPMQLSATSGSLSYAVGETKSFGPFDLSRSETDNLNSLLASLQAVGGGSFDLRCESSSGLRVIGGGGNINTSQSTQANCGASIVYTYTPTPIVDVPEPGALALVGIALAGLGLARRRKA